MKGFLCQIKHCTCNKKPAGKLNILFNINTMRLLTKFSVIATLCAGVTLTTSCGDDNNSNEPDPDPVTPETPSQSQALSPVEQKKYLEDAAIEFMDQLDSDDFKDLADFGQYISDKYGDYDFDNVSQWAEDIFDSLTENLNTTTKEKDEYGGTYYYNNYKAIVMASNFHSHFTASNNSWKRTDANDLQFIFKDENAQECVLKLETSGSVSKVHVCNIDDWYDYDYGYENGDYYYTDYYDRTQLTIGVPEKISVTLTRGSKTILNTIVNIDLSSISNEEFDLSKSELNVSMSTELDNGYKFILNQASYSSSKVSASCTITKNGSTLVSSIASSDINDVPALKLTESFDEVEDNEDMNATNVYAKLDILGKVQLQGTLSDIRKFVEYLDEADNNDDRESVFKSYLNQSNALADINLFYDGKSVKQATVSFEAFEDYSYGGTTYWTAEPIITFYDGSSYSTFEAFFNDVDFKKTINTFENLIDAYENLLN